VDPSGHAGPQCTARKCAQLSHDRGGVQLSGGHAAHDTPAAPGRPPPGTPTGGRRLRLGEVEPRPLGPLTSLDLAGNYVEAAGAESLAPALAAMTQGAQARRAWGQSPSTAASIRAFVG
jgi:hypothetical protein